MSNETKLVETEIEEAVMEQEVEVQETMEEVDVSDIPEDEETEETPEPEETAETTEAQEVPAENTEINIDHPYFAGFKKAINKSLQEAVSYTDEDTTAIVTAKIEVNESYNSPDFANDAKMINPVSFSVGLSTKRDFDKIKGCSKGFVARMENGHYVLIDSDRQMSMEEIEAKIESVDDGDDIGTAMIMGDSFFDPDNAIEGEVTEYHAGEENQVGIDDIETDEPEEESDTEEGPDF